MKEELEKRLNKLSINEIDYIYKKVIPNTTQLIHTTDTINKLKKIEILLKPFENKSNVKLSKTCQQSIRNISKSFTKKKIRKFYDKYTNKQQLEYSLSCAGKDRIKKEVANIIYKNRIHERKWEQEIDKQINTYLKQGYI
jgi:hypothetical protein